MDLDDSETTLLRRQIIQDKPLLKNIYEDWYGNICTQLPVIDGPVLEIGTGAGFLKSYIPDLITSDVMPIQGNDVTCNAEQLPFSDRCLRAIVMVNVMHHISHPIFFFKEAERCVRPGGVIIMVEPWVTCWSKIIYGKLHHEPFDPESPCWTLPESGPLSGGNDALPWIIFQRDNERFNTNTAWRVEKIVKTMPFRYLLCGGISMRNLLPAFMIRPITALENSLSPQMMSKVAMFALVVLKQHEDVS